MNHRFSPACLLLLALFAWSMPAQAWGHSVAGINVVVYGLDGYASRVAGLGADVTATSTPGGAAAALPGQQVLWVSCCGLDDDFSSAQVAAILSFVSAGGGLIIGQPDRNGPVGILPAGFEVNVADILWSGDPSDLSITPLGLTRPLTSELAVADLSGNFETVHKGDIGSLWDVLVEQRGTDSVALLAGSLGSGRLIFETGNLSSSSFRPGSDHYVQNLLCWAAFCEPAAVPSASTLYLLGAGIAGLVIRRHLRLPRKENGPLSVSGLGRDLKLGHRG